MTSPVSLYFYSIGYPCVSGRDTFLTPKRVIKMATHCVCHDGRSSGGEPDECSVLAAKDSRQEKAPGA